MLQEHLAWLKARHGKLLELREDTVVGTKEWVQLCSRIGELEECIENADRLLGE